MDTEEVCENCKREIPSVNYVMHVAHCSRNVEICSDCGEPVHKSLKEQHKKNNHETAECELCGKDVMRSELQNHINNSCSNRLVECVTCGIEVRFSHLNDHELYCQSRTEFCDRCQKYVMIKDLDNHNCESYIPKDKIVTIPCEFCGQQVDVVELEEHQLTCTAADDDLEVINEPSDDDSYIATEETSDGCHGSYIARGAETFDGYHGKEDIYALPCEFCSELCPSDKLYAHQSECVNSYDDDDDHDAEYFNNGERRPGRTPSTGLGVDTGEREDPFNMVTLQEFLLGSVLNSMTTEPHTTHFE